MNKGKIYYIINNLLDKFDNGEKIEEDMFIDTLVRIRNIIEENTNKSLLDENYNLQSKIDKAIEWIEQYEKQIGTLGETSKSIVLTDDVVIGNLLDILKEDK